MENTIVFDRNDCIEKTIVWLSGLKGEPSDKIVEYN